MLYNDVEEIAVIAEAHFTFNSFAYITIFEEIFCHQRGVFASSILISGAFIHRHIGLIHRVLPRILKIKGPKLKFENSVKQD